MLFTRRMNIVTLRSLFAAAAAAGVTLFAGATAHADDPAATAAASTVSVVSSAFTDKVDGGKPVGDASAAAHAPVVTYWLAIKNTSDTQDVVLVWKRDGREVVKQHLSIGQSPRWQTWGACPVAGAHEMEVEVQDADGHVLKSDTLATR